MMRPLLYIMLSFLVNFIYGQEVVEPATTMNPGEFQAQIATIYTESRELRFRESEIAYNNTLLLYGIVPNLELRLGIDITSSETRENGLLINDRLQGTTPLQVGAKYRFIQQTEAFPEVSVMSHVFLPLTASSDNKPDYLGYDLWLLGLHQLNDQHALLANIGAATGGDSRDILPLYILAHNWLPFEKWGLNTEVYGEFPKDSVAMHYFDIGISHFFKPTIQLDLNAGRGLNNNQTILASVRLTYTII
ncbi:hypothetical protein AAU57_03455 [Nonlabens sp. YIK11]|uniref:transporter n=1 Tax=Nonlabens sp. YIK11 TaxID=1453349 RepID=UPI0006DBEEC5|nr:transporter [Nonlabens sp. YIK11]KQC32494.1 hypothetical protein AAU57_03455 [Nonlabens sp. YIK11]